MKLRDSLGSGDEASELPAGRAARSYSHATIYKDRLVPSRRSIETNLRRNSSLAKPSLKLKSNPYQRYLSEEMLPQ